MTYKGWLLPTTERMPRIRTLEELPRPEAALFICKTGLTSISSFSVSAGNKKYQTYFSYANTFQRLRDSD